jgi:V/A-type H+-transporting ATPase subunit E
VTINLERLVEDILRESKNKAEEVKKEGLLQIEESIARARADAIRDADQIIREAKTESEAARNRRVSQEKQKARLTYLAAKNKVVSDVLKTVQTRLADFCADEPSYRPFLLRTIARGIGAISSQTVRVALSEKDLRRLRQTKLLEDALAVAQTTKKVTLSDEAIETIGGAIVTSQDNKIVVDCTLEAKLELMKPQILAEISRILFAPESE